MCLGDLTIDYLGDTFPKVDQCELYNMIISKVEEDWNISDIITWLVDSELWWIEEKGLRAWLYIRKCRIEDYFIEKKKGK